ncbi:HIT family protein [Dactylosporangium cerinum]|uniref:HIT family protein n=1 Tax=Dactylosporangium cerinum TaxID=1434730 RepID=A0ABV9VNX5_9ACTN
MDGEQPAKTVFDVDQYHRLVQDGPCFVCAFLSGHPDYRHHRVYEDEDTVAFLARYPTQLGYTLVVPRAHVESWVEQLEEDEFRRFQGVVHKVARAVAATLPTERMYSMSLGSQQGNTHLHWHVVPLPPGVPYGQQQFHAVMAEHGVLAVDDAAQAELARRISAHL